MISLLGSGRDPSSAISETRRPSSGRSTRRMRASTVAPSLSSSTSNTVSKSSRQSASCRSLGAIRSRSARPTDPALIANPTSSRSAEFLARSVEAARRPSSDRPLPFLRNSARSVSSGTPVSSTLRCRYSCWSTGLAAARTVSIKAAAMAARPAFVVASCSALSTSYWNATRSTAASARSRNASTPCSRTRRSGSKPGGIGATLTSSSICRSASKLRTVACWPAESES